MSRQTVQPVLVGVRSGGKVEAQRQTEDVARRQVPARRKLTAREPHQRRLQPGARPAP
jgi:hypothetical protein